ncbi:MAG: hypothetical protein BIFFINMI_01170 [Phycisphaerae bacterium]|nr:hypothetical protein [Phycisphaerae bacterium]
MTQFRSGSYKLGLVVAVVMLAIIGGGVAWILWPKGPKDPEPSEAARELVKNPIKIDLDITGIVEAPKGQAGDGAEDIHKAMAAYETKKRADSDLDRKLKPINPGALPPTMIPPLEIADLLESAADKQGFNLYPRYFPVNQLEWRRSQKFNMALDRVASAAIIEAARWAGRGEQGRERARSILRAVLILGHNLATRPDVRVWTQELGVRIESVAAEHLAWLYGQMGRADEAAKARSFRDLAEDTRTRINRTASSMFAAQNKWKPGDLILVARKHPDRAWKIEALLALGMVRFNPTVEEYGQAVDRCINDFSNDPDEWVQSAARWAKDLTEADYNSQTGTSLY